MQRSRQRRNLVSSQPQASPASTSTASAASKSSSTATSSSPGITDSAGAGPSNVRAQKLLRKHFSKTSSSAVEELYNYPAILDAIERTGDMRVLLTVFRHELQGLQHDGPDDEGGLDPVRREGIRQLKGVIKHAEINVARSDRKDLVAKQRADACLQRGPAAHRRPVVQGQTVTTGSYDCAVASEQPETQRASWGPGASETNVKADSTLGPARRRSERASQTLPVETKAAAVAHSGAQVGVTGPPSPQSISGDDSDAAASGAVLNMAFGGVAGSSGGYIWPPPVGFGVSARVATITGAGMGEIDFPRAWPTPTVARMHGELGAAVNAAFGHATDSPSDQPVAALPRPRKGWGVAGESQAATVASGEIRSSRAGRDIEKKAADKSIGAKRKAAGPTSGELGRDEQPGTAAGSDAEREATHSSSGARGDIRQRRAASGSGAAEMGAASPETDKEDREELHWTDYLDLL